MHRRVIATVAGSLVVLPAIARAEETSVAAGAAKDEDIGDQLIAAELGVAVGGRVTPGGLRVSGHYLYQLTEQDWFDGTASFTFGGGDAECFRNRDDEFLCDHG